MTKFKADKVDDFLKAAHKKFHGNSVGDTNFPKTKQLWKGKLNNGRLTLSWTFPQITMDYAEVGGGKPDKANKDAIAEVARLAKQHEEKHKAGYEAAIKDWDPDKVKKDLESKTYKNDREVQKAVNDAVDDLYSKMMKACLDLHKKEGVIVVAHGANGTIDVSMEAAGASGCE